MKITRLLFFLLISVAFVGCSTQSFTIAPGGGTQAATRTNFLYQWYWSNTNIECKRNLWRK